MFSIVWGLSLLAFLFGTLNLFDFYPALISPGLVGIVYLVFLFNPLPILFYKARIWLLKRLVSFRTEYIKIFVFGNIFELIVNSLKLFCCHLLMLFVVATLISILPRML